MSPLRENFHICAKYTANLFNKQSPLKISDERVHKAFLRLFVPIGLALASTAFFSLARLTRENQIGMAILNFSVAGLWYMIFALGPNTNSPKSDR